MHGPFGGWGTIRDMRSFLAAIALLLAALAGIAASVAYVAHQTVLDPSRFGDVLTTALKQPGLRDTILSSALPGYGSLPASYQAEVDRAAQRPEVDRALGRVRIDAQGRVRLGGMRQEMAQSLRDHGQSQLAAQVDAATGHDTLTIPSSVASRYTDARDTAWTVATRGALAAVVLFLVSLLVARNRRAALAAVGVTLLVCFGATALLYAFLPTVAGTVSSSPWVQAAAGTGRASVSTVASMLLPVALAGVGALLVSFVLPSRRHR